MAQAKRQVFYLNASNASGDINSNILQWIEFLCHSEVNVKARYR